MAGQLPFHALTIVFAAVRGSDPSPDTLRDLVFVCRSWADAASFVLYDSVALYGGATAALFNRTIGKCPQRAYLVRTLLLALELDDDAAAGRRGTDEEGRQLVKVLAVCPNVVNLALRPLPPSVRPALLAAIASKRLDTLSCAPRLSTPHATPFYASDLVSLVQPSLQELELDCWTSSLDTGGALLPSFPSTLHLTHLKLAFAGAEKLILRLLAAAQSLEVVYVYIEAMFEDPAALASALMPSATTLRSLTLKTNPPLEARPGQQSPYPPAFNRILPHFHQLDYLSISASEISPEALRFLPPSLTHLEIESITDFPHFDFSSHLFRVLSSTSFTLQTLIIHDDGWRVDEAEAVRIVCAGKGIKFACL